MRTRISDGRELRTDCIGGTREDERSGHATGDREAESIVMGVETVEGPHPRHNRTLVGIIIFRSI